ncbi:PucR family transcriptional regulator [Mycobacterium sp. PSTR-4-N]|uniref:PucR family transcriptional regulator n=1 Tax=Mycobacterium sp. PSTR-4-N TaxID=2917745 RepID=UPI001F14F392|nr:PucR family transcriptional regulator [Mycobacterium sp. PSTR-4-N]MCG7592589.1 PucR family transcriptional regulator [Mycobacterium sp. PSTR-4-N]
MAITVRELVGVERLGLRLVAGQSAADSPIAWAHAIELADPTPYLAGGELVMTTGINIGADAAAQSAYVTRLAEAGSAALAVDTGTTLREIPAGVLDAGDRAGLPVLEVPPSTPFIAITKTVIDALADDELRAVQQVVDGQEVLARATVSGGIPGVVDALADRLAATVVVLGADRSVLAAAGPQRARLLAALTDSAPAARRGAYVTGDSDAFITVQNLSAAQSHRGRLAIRSTAPLSTADRFLLAHAVSLVSIALEKPTGVVEAEQRLRSAVTRELLRGSGLVDDGVLRYFGFAPHDEVVVVLLTEVGPMLAAQQEWGRRLAAAGPYLMVHLTTTGSELVIVVPATARLADTGSVRAPVGGASGPVPLSDIAVGLEQARIACHAGGARFTHFPELGPLDVLLAGRTAAELAVLAAPLTALSVDLVATLEAYLRHNGHLEGAATATGVHRHTLRHRMRRIGDALDDDLDDADTRTRLWLAIRARQLLADRPQPPSGGGPER